MQGKIIKGIAGFYYVDAAESGIYECRARGIFRKEKVKPLVGDNAVIEILDEEKKEGNLIGILPRTNELIRPAAANVGQALIIFAIASPNPNFLLLDRFLAAMELKGIPSAVCFNKKDLVLEDEVSKIREIYGKCGHRLFFTSLEKGEGAEELHRYLEGKTTLLAGPSGVGKSTLANLFQNGIRMETGEISRKLARGKNTTRHAELIPMGNDTYIFDTPGFSFFDEPSIEKEELRHYYAEFGPYEGKCRFDGCVHISEPDCAVREAVAQGTISQTRYDNYCRLYADLKELEKRRY